MVFISHKMDHDHDKALQIRKTLHDNGISSWIAPEDLAPGAHYADEIPSAIRTCEVFLLLLTEEAQRSAHVLKEVDLAIKYKKKIIPIQFGEVTLTDRYDYMLSNEQIKNVGQNYDNFDEVLDELKIGERVYNVPIGQKHSKREFSLIKGDFQENMQWIICNPEFALNETVFVMGIDCSSKLELSSNKGILKDVITMLQKQYGIGVDYLQELVNQAKMEQLGHSDNKQEMCYGDSILIRIPLLVLGRKAEENLQILLVANSCKKEEFYTNSDIDAVEGIDSRIIILKIFDRCRKLKSSATNIIIGAIGTNGLEFPYEVITAEILNAFIFAVIKDCSPYHLFYSVRISDFERVGMTTEKIYHYIRNVVKFF